MNAQTGWKAVALVVGMTSALWAAEVSQTEYRAPNTEAPRGETTTRVKAQATVQKIDAKTRMITLKNEAGETSEIKAGPEVQRFDEIKKGDVVQVEYVESQALYVEKAAKGAVPTQDGDAIAGRVASEKPAAFAAETEKISAEVVKVDYKKRMITLKSADGTITTTHVPDNVRRLNEVKKGDHVVAERTVAVALSVNKP
jgi:Cu/Ag efflux protein CusF